MESVMPIQKVTLTPEMDRFVKDEIASGRFDNASEVHKAALTGLARSRQRRLMKVERLKTEIQKGLDDSAAGRVIRVNSRSELRALVRSFAPRRQATASLEALNAELAE